MPFLPVGQSLISFAPPRQARAQLRRDYETRAGVAQSRFEARFGTYRTLDEVMTDFPAQLDLALTETSAAVASDLVGAAIFDWDDQAVRQSLEGRLEALMDTFLELENAYAEIGAKASAREDRRGNAGQDRAYVAGGGFGVEGAAKGMAVATAANAALGLVYGAADAAGRALANQQDSRTKRALFEHPRTRLTLAKVIRDVTFEGQALLAHVLNQERKSTQVEEISAEAERRSGALSNNVALDRIPAEQVKDVLTQAIELNPYSATPWRLWIEKLGDADGSVLKASEALGILGLQEHRDALLEKARGSLAWSTPEDCLQSSLVLEARALALGVPFESEKAQIQAKAQQLDEARRTYNGTLYATLNEAIAAREADEDTAKRTVAGSTYATHDEAAAARTEWLNEQARTYRGKQYLSPESARAARSRHHRATSLALWFGVLIAPIPTALLTLQAGFSRRQRIVAFVWLGGVVVIQVLSGNWNSAESVLSTLTAYAVLGALAWVLSLVETNLRTRFMSWAHRTASTDQVSTA